jgi:hypothetical protein
MLEQAQTLSELAGLVRQMYAEDLESGYVVARLEKRYAPLLGTLLPSQR